MGHVASIILQSMSLTLTLWLFPLIGSVPYCKYLPWFETIIITSP